MRVQVVQPYNISNVDTAWKNSTFILSKISDFHIVDNLSIVALTLPMFMLRSLSVDEILLSR